MWIWIIIGACVIGAIFGFLGSNEDSRGADAAGGALAGGCMAASCIGRIALTVFVIWLVFRLFVVLFG